ncbi:MAG: DUF2844 domain-containing protein [Polyangiaceae bacterium]|jgi:hypothetical protein
MTPCRTAFWTVASLALAFASPSQALAALGDDAASISADSAVLGGTRQVSRAAAWEVHELRLPTGTVVREYLRDKTVFALAWGGPVMPNLRRLLGAYFEPYVHSPRGREAGHHLRVVVTPAWAVQSAGHQAGFIGRAWLPQHLPAGFELDTVRAW